MTNTDILPRISIITKDGIKSEIPYSRAVFALGTFDGVHIAHKALLQKACELKKGLCADALAVFSFSESPASVMGRASREVLTEKDEKIRLLLENGADAVITAEFEDFRDMPAEVFISDVLCSALSCVGTVCGFNHRFGKGGNGNFDLLEGFFGKGSALSVPRITLDGDTVSSSTVRSLLSAGDTEKANRMLGRAYTLSSEVTSGKMLGRRLGFPTANQAFPRGSVKLRRGVYATRCRIGEDLYLGVSNVGVRPSISENDDHALNCETYILDFSGDIYGELMTVEFHRHLRDEKAFPSLDELRSAIEKDKACVTEYFKTHSFF